MSVSASFFGRILLLLCEEFGDDAIGQDQFEAFAEKAGELERDYKAAQQHSERERDYRAAQDRSRQEVNEP